MKHFRLGASLYVPATRPDLVDVANGRTRTPLRSVIFCTEDAVSSHELATALRNLEAALQNFGPSKMLRFVRVRSPEILHRLLKADGIASIDGFVIPKATRCTVPQYLELLTDHPAFSLMPTLESAEAFDPCEMRELRALLCEPTVRPRILSLRIGGLDMLNLLGLTRQRGRTIYDTAVGHHIAALVGLFRPWGFNLTAPVFDGLDHPDVLMAEVEQDLAHALFGKSAVHPHQVPLIEERYAVMPGDLARAEECLRSDAPAVFRLDDRMCEPATQWHWAETTRMRAEVYGLTSRPPVEQ